MTWTRWKIYWIISVFWLTLSSIFLVHDIYRIGSMQLTFPYQYSRFYNLSKKDRHRIQTYGRIYATEPRLRYFDPDASKWTLSEKIMAFPDVQVASVDCAQLMRGDTHEISRALRLQEHITPVKINFATATSNCSQFREYRGYLEFASPEELEFPVAFGIMMFIHPEQTERLLRAIYRPHNYYCIHVDKKARYADILAMEAIASCFSNVAVATTSINVHWGEYSVIEPEFACLKDLWPIKKWRYYINLTGQEFPLQTTLDIVKILKMLRGANFISGEIKNRPRGRTDYVYKHTERTRTRKSAPPHGIRLAKGSLKMAMSRGFVDYILHSQVASDFLEWVRDTQVPDETFFQSLNHNPQLGVPGAFTGDPDESYSLLITRYIVWEQVKGSTCQGKWVRDCCVFGVGDLATLQSRSEMFVNKLHHNFHPLAYDCLEEMYFHRTKNEIFHNNFSHLNMSSYESLPYIAQHVGVSPGYNVWHQDRNSSLSR